MPKILPLLALLSLHVGSPASAQSQQDRPDSARVRAVRTMVMSDLRNFLTAQERFFADQLTYAKNLREMERVFYPSPGVTLVVLTSSDRGHSEIAIHADVPDLVCAMYVGDSPQPFGRGREGEVVCKGP